MSYVHFVDMNERLFSFISFEEWAQLFPYDSDSLRTEESRKLLNTASLPCLSKSQIVKKKNGAKKTRNQIQQTHKKSISSDGLQWQSIFSSDNYYNFWPYFEWLLRTPHPEMQ